MQLMDNELAFELGNNGEYKPVSKTKEQKSTNSQEFFENYMNRIFRTIKKGSDQDKVQIMAQKLLKES